MALSRGTLSPTSRAAPLLLPRAGQYRARGVWSRMKDTTRATAARYQTTFGSPSHVELTASVTERGKGAMIVAESLYQSTSAPITVDVPIVAISESMWT